MLILTENYAALDLLQQQLPDLKNAMVIFGSSFPKDQEYTQVLSTFITIMHREKTYSNIVRA